MQFNVDRDDWEADTSFNLSWFVENARCLEHFVCSPIHVPSNTFVASSHISDFIYKSPLPSSPHRKQES